MACPLGLRVGPGTSSGLVLALTLSGGLLRADTVPRHDAGTAPPPAPASHEEAASPAATPPEGQPAEAKPDDGRRTLARLPVNLGRGVVGLWSRGSLPPLLAGGTVTGIAFTVDQDVRNAVGKPGSPFSGALQTIGGPAVIGPLVGGLFVAGRIAHPARFRATTYDLLEAWAVNEGITQLLKASVSRQRPDQSDNKSFPSGHASTNFTLATVVQLHYGWKLGVPCYLFAGLVAYSRIERDVHFLSDVTAGATIGVVVALAVVRMNDRPLRTGRAGAWIVAPILGPHTYGLQVTLLR